MCCGWDVGDWVVVHQPIILLAASGLAREVLTTIEQSGTGFVAGILDDDAALHGRVINGVNVFGGIESVEDHPEAQFVVCAGSGIARRQIVERLAGRNIGAARMATVIHPTVSVPSTCIVGRGSVVLAQTVLTADVTVGDHVVVMPHVVLTHDDTVSDFATLCAGVVLGGNVRVGAGSYLGMSSSVRQNVKLGEGATLGMGSALLQDVPAGETWAGVPAAPLTGRSGSGSRRPGLNTGIHTTAERWTTSEKRTG
jgi:sugar O-acyltransferase (sialic acid O-acetyltransferase NeuD family)